MNAFETFMLDFAKAAVTSAPQTVPVFVHSPQGIAIFGASEAFAVALAQVIAQQHAPAPTA